MRMLTRCVFTKRQKKITLLARNLPCSLGRHDAEERVQSETERLFPLKSVIRKKAGSVLRCFRFFRGRSTETSTT